jgi:hypothetical protein
MAIPLSTSNLQFPHPSITSPRGVALHGPQNEGEKMLKTHNHHWLIYLTSDVRKSVSRKNHFHSPPVFIWKQVEFYRFSNIIYIHKLMTHLSRD